MAVKGDSKLTKLTITNVAAQAERITAFVNPTHIAFDQAVKWTAVKGDKSDAPAVEYTQGDPAKLKLELLFDTYESKADVYETYIAGLRSFCQVPKKSKGKKKHPPLVLVEWGNKDFMKFTGVITALAVKYTYFLPDGTPTRATASISVQASKRAKAKVPRARRSGSSGTPSPTISPTPTPTPAPASGGGDSGTS